jgi:UDP-2,3-diacylglucosamine hydrolase
MAGPDPSRLATPELTAPAAWRTLEFVSDVHLSADEPATAAAWSSYLAHTQADAVFVLGDLFEVWIGDDQCTAGDSFTQACIQALHQLSQRSPVFFMHGNRDFLAGQALMQACGTTLLADPTALVLGQERVLLSHGDALCLDDARYLAFRAQVRSPDWQQAFLAKPLQERQALARQLRLQSQQEQAQRMAAGQQLSEVDNTAADKLLQDTRCQWLLHGHTHRPARHRLASGRHREVLSDWDAQARPPRAQVLRLHLQPGAPSTLERHALL